MLYDHKIYTLAGSVGKTVEKPQELPGKVCPKEIPREIRLSRGAQPQGKVWLPEGPPVGKFPDNSLGFSTVSQTWGFKNRRECVPQELSEHILGFPQGSLTVLNPYFGFEVRSLS